MVKQMVYIDIGMKMKLQFEENYKNGEANGLHRYWHEMENYNLKVIIKI